MRIPTGKLRPDGTTLIVFKAAGIATSAGLYGNRADPVTFHVRHAEVVGVSEGRAQLVGFSDAEPVTKTLSLCAGR